MRIAIATDAWHPQHNGVVRVIGTVVNRLIRLGYEVRVISPDLFRTFPCPTYRELPIALSPKAKTWRNLEEFRPDAVHIATEGPIGHAARAWCLKKGFPFTSAFHTKFPEYISARTGLPASWIYPALRRFHRPSRGVMVPAKQIYRELEGRGFANLRQWRHGVDSDVFAPGPKNYLDGLGLLRPIFMYVGRVTVEKNVPAFLDLNLPGSKVVVGSGPARASLMARYPEVLFRTADGDGELARYYNASDVFVFPSRTDTFGLVALEALACGVPVAAFPVTGPRDVIGDSGAGILREDLRSAAMDALAIAPEKCRNHAITFSWDKVVEAFLTFLHPVNGAG